jgi:hypothetical protein
MKNILFLALLFISLNSFSQCLNNKDSFTGVESTAYIIKIGGLINIGNNLMFAKEKGRTAIVYSWMIQSSGDYDTDVTKTSLLIKFDDGEVLKFKPDADSKITNANGYVVYAFVSELTQENMDKLKTKNADAIRFGIVDDKGVDLNMTKKNLKEIKDGIVCVSK